MELGFVSNKLLSFMASRSLPSEDGKKKIKLNVEELLEIKDFFTLTAQLRTHYKDNVMLKLTKKIISTLESPLKNKKTISTGKRVSYYLNSPTCKVVKDIGSGLNYKRKGLRKLLELSNQGKVSKIIVFSKDRLCRFGFDLLEYVFENNGTEVVVFESDKKTKEEEFCEDILSILQVFSCRWNGRRKYRIDIKDDKNKKDKVNIEFSTEENV